MSTEIILLVEESPEGGYEAKALGYSIYTEAETLDELRHNIRDAVQCHFGHSSGYTGANGKISRRSLSDHKAGLARRKGDLLCPNGTRLMMPGNG